MKKTVFIDGQHGTTGLRIRERLRSRSDITILEIPEASRKDPKVKANLINQADAAILCLPDDAARETVSLITNPATKIIDTSTAHRVDSGWEYGLPELDPRQRMAIAGSNRIANPGCYPTGFILGLNPLVRKGVVPSGYQVTSYALTGYSGGGKKMIADFESVSGPNIPEIACRPKNLNLMHKHLPEMQKYAGLDSEPLFVPLVGNFYSGMLVFIPLFSSLMSYRATPAQLRDILDEYYANEPFVRVASADECAAIGDGFVSALAANDTNLAELFVLGRADQVIIVARLDNLGKGASGAAIQNLNIVLGVEESLGLSGSKRKPAA